jgi:hypothetical protein
MQADGRLTTACIEMTANTIRTYPPQPQPQPQAHAQAQAFEMASAIASAAT